MNSAKSGPSAKVRWLVASIIVQMALISTTFLKVLPPTFGFFLTWSNIARERLMYKDFFFPLPPVALIIEGDLPNLFPNPVFAEQIIQAVTWLLISTLIYLILERTFQSPTIAFLSATLGLTAYYCSPGNITAGYLELTWLFILASTWFGMRAIVNNRIRDSLLAGCFLSLAVLTKQSAIVIVVLLFAAWLLIPLVDEKFGRKGWAVRVACLACGFATPVIPFLVVGLANGTLGFAVEDIFGGGGKDVGSGNWVWWLANSFNPAVSYTPAIAILLLAVLHTRKKLLIGRGWLAGTLFAVAALGSMSNNVLSIPAQGPFAIISLLFIILISTIVFTSYGQRIIDIISTFAKARTTRSLNAFDPVPILAIGLSCLLIYLGTFRLNNFDGGAQAYLGNEQSIFNAVGGAVTLALVFWLLGTLVTGLKTDFERITLVIAINNLGFAVMNSASGGLSIETWLLAVPFGIGWLLSVFSLANLNTLKRILVLPLILLPILAFTGSQSLNPYNWWGIAEKPLTSPRGHVKTGHLAVFNLSETEANVYNGLNITLHKSSLNDVDKNAPVLFGPNLAGVPEALSDRYKLYNLKCPVIWFDICPPNLANNDSQKIQNDPPKYIVWNFAPEFVITGHEQGFLRGKKSAIRSIQSWMEKEISDGNYKVIFKDYSGTDSNAWKLVVLKKANRNATF